VTELPKDRDIVVICHHGARSQQVALFLVNSGFNRVHNLQGGVHAWALQVDPTMPRY
jgi:rhodanese-related sulfurtransferase